MAELSGTFLRTAVRLSLKPDAHRLVVRLLDQLAVQHSLDANAAELVGVERFDAGRLALASYIFETLSAGKSDARSITQAAIKSFDIVCWFIPAKPVEAIETLAKIVQEQISRGPNNFNLPLQRIAGLSAAAVGKALRRSDPDAIRHLFSE